ncbi:MAG: hypothetical protein ABSA93_08105 [Streptosporangiaceae bacterium]
MPNTDTYPPVSVTAAPQVDASDNAADGTVVEHELELDGSPMMIALYSSNSAVVIASHVEADATVTDTPDGTSSASGLDEPSLTLVVRISTDFVDAFAFAGCTVTWIATGTIASPITTSGTVANAVPRRSARPR